MNNKTAIIAIIIMSAITIILRFAPFLVFSGKKTPDIITYLGKVLPYSVMGMLVVYCLKGVSFGNLSHFLPELIACAIVAVSYYFKRNTIISIIGGTAVYMLLIQFVFV